MPPLPSCSRSRHVPIRAVFVHWWTNLHRMGSLPPSESPVGAKSPGRRTGSQFSSLVDEALTRHYACMQTARRKRAQCSPAHQPASASHSNDFCPLMDKNASDGKLPSAKVRRPTPPGPGRGAGRGAALAGAGLGGHGGTPQRGAPGSEVRTSALLGRLRRIDAPARDAADGVAAEEHRVNHHAHDCGPAAHNRSRSEHAHQVHVGESEKEV